MVNSHEKKLCFHGDHWYMGNFFLLNGGLVLNLLCFQKAHPPAQMGKGHCYRQKEMGLNQKRKKKECGPWNSGNE